MARDRYDDDYDDRPRRSRRDDDDYYDDDYDDYRPRGMPPPNYLAAAIITTLLCCWPAGVVAIVYAAQVNSKWAGGDTRGALEASANAKMWSWISFGGFMLIMVVYVLFIVLMVAAGK